MNLENHKEMRWSRHVEMSWCVQLASLRSLQHRGWRRGASPVWGPEHLLLSQPPNHQNTGTSRSADVGPSGFGTPGLDVKKVSISFACCCSTSVLGEGLLFSYSPRILEFSWTCICFFLNWSILVLQCCINYCWTAKWLSHTYIYTFIFFLCSFPWWFIPGYWI